jgi:CheY-like chemotaxis protein/nitrogen-specific signal transduction histidine kinase
MTEKTILLVDDEADIRQVLEITLADMGYRVLTAENGDEALEIFRKTQPPIVLTDIKMPGMDGIRLLQKIKQENPDTEVIMITGHGDMELAIQSFQDNATDFVTKPVGVDALETALKKARDKIRIRQQLQDYTENLETLLFEKSARGPEAGEGTPDTPHRLQQVLDQLPCYILIHDSRLIITAANRRFQEDFGDTVGKPCYEACKNRTEPCPDCPVLKTFADGKSYQYEMEYIPANGVPKKVLAWTLPVLSSDGVATQVMVMSTDVSQISELQDHLSSIGLMVGSLSHGIKGMLTGLDSGMYLLGSGIEAENADRTREGLDVVKQTVERLKKMVLDILFYAKDRALKKEKVDVLEFARDVARTVGPKITSQGVEFIQVFDEPLGASAFDAGFLIQALVNIFENALEACGEDKVKTSHTIRFHVSSDSKEILFGIRDDGIGMDSKTRKQMFQLFFSSKGEKGTGLGLFITHKIVHQHGGTIDVRSAPGEGTEIRVRIPRSRGSAL